MKKAITIFVLMVVLISSLSSCKKENKVVVTPQNKILFTAKQSGITNIVKLNTATKDKQILSTTPFKLEKPIFSPDKKKVVFQTRRGSSDSNIWDVYIMNLDGTELINLTKDLNLFQSINQQIDYLFSPDPKQVLIRETIATSTTNTLSIHQVNIDGIFVETFYPTHSGFNLLDCLFEGLKKSYSIKLDDDHFLLKNKNILGSLKWSNQEFTPIISFTEPIDDYYLSPDNQFILLNIITEKEIRSYIFNIKLKKTTKITPSFGKDHLQLHIFWLQDEMKFIYSTYFFTEKSGRKVAESFLYLYDVQELESTQLDETQSEIVRFQQYSDHEFIGGYGYYDSPPDLVYFDIKTKKIEGIQGIQDQ